MGPMDSINDLLARSEALIAQAATVLKPRTPITSKELFAGRWTELTEISDAVHQAGLHVVVYGERGVGKTSLANVVRPTIWALDEYGKQPDEVTPRLIVQTVANSADTFSELWYRLFGEIQWPNPELKRS